MKILFFIITVSVLAEKNWDKYSKEDIELLQKRQWNQQKAINQRELRAATYFLTQGSPRKAITSLQRVVPANVQDKAKLYRLRSLAHFIIKDYRMALEDISNRLFDRAYFSETCLFRVMLQLFTQTKTKLLEKTLRECKSATILNSPSRLFWVNQLVRTRVIPPYEVRKSTLVDIAPPSSGNDQNDAILWAQTALFLSKEKQYINMTKNWPKYLSTSPTMKELLGVMSFRIGKLEDSEEYLKNITTANSLNIKGLINFRNKKYQKSYDYFSQALGLKKNSINALEKLIPLSWKLKKHEEALHYLGLFPKNHRITKQKDLLRANFLILLKKHKKAQNILMSIFKKSKDNPSVQLLIHLSYNSLILGERKLIRKFALKSCKKYRGIHCWIYGNIFTWQDLPLTLQRTDLIMKSREFTLKQIKSTPIIKGLEEETLISQESIDELDALDIRLEATNK